MNRPDHSAMKLGKQMPRRDHRTLQLADYLVTLPTVPANRAWSQKATMAWGMMANDQYGCCELATCGHLVQTWTANTGMEITPTDEQILAAYSAVTGFNPADPSTDNGTVVLDALNYWRKNAIGGTTIDAYMAVEPRNHAHVMAAIDLFGGISCGFALPLTAQNQRVWSVVRHSGHNGEAYSWGGHAVPIIDYDAGGLTCVTWGELKRLTWSFLDKYMDEAYALLSPDWAAVGRMAPSGFDHTQLQADLAAL